MSTRYWFNSIGFTSIVAAVIAATPLAANASPLTLEGYLLQVQRGHKGIQGSLETSQGAFQRSEESELLLSPQLFSDVLLSRDEKENSTPTILGERKTFNTYSLGIRKLTRFGLSGAVSYNLSYLSLEGTDPTRVPEPTYHDAGPKLELSLPVWRNGFGRETRATQDLLEAQALATAYGNRYQSKVSLSQAEGLYWRLAFARAAVDVQKDSLARARKIRDWNARRVRLQLGDRSDLLQADGLVELRRLELQSALDEELAAARAFNTARGIYQDLVTEELARPEYAALRRIAPPARAELRDDVQAARQTQRLTKAQASVAREKALPSLDFFVQGALNAHDPALAAATGSSFSSQNPTLAGGVKFSAPLDLGSVKATRQGYAREQLGADLSYERKVFEMERDWHDLIQKLDEAQRRLEVSRQLVEIQREKATYERDRLNRGRTTTFQVLTFEQDYANAQLGFIRAQSEVLGIVAQMKVFGGTR